MALVGKEINPLRQELTLKADDTNGRQRGGFSVPDNDIFDITTATQSRSASIKARRRRYLIAMSIRVACFLGMVILPLPIEGRIALAAGAIFLPYIAVVAANAYGGRFAGPSKAYYSGNSARALPR